MRLVRDDDVDVMDDNPADLEPAPDPADGVIDEADDPADLGIADDIQVDLRTLEALLFSTHHPLTAGRLGELLDLDSTKPVRRAIKELNEQYLAGDRSFRIEQVAGGYQLLTLPEFGEILQKLHQRETDAKLSKAALETLAIIAYRQPIGRAEIEEIRGVGAGAILKSLAERGLIDIVGRGEGLGRPLLYGTTPSFLEQFALRHLEELPRADELAIALRAPRPATPTSPVPATTDNGEAPPRAD